MKKIRTSELSQWPKRSKSTTIGISKPWSFKHAGQRLHKRHETNEAIHRQDYPCRQCPVCRRSARVGINSKFPQIMQTGAWFWHGIWRISGQFMTKPSRKLWKAGAKRIQTQMHYNTFDRYRPTFVNSFLSAFELVQNASVVHIRPAI